MGVVCPGCDDVTVGPKICKDCPKLLCENCVPLHKRHKKTKTHQIVSVEEYFKILNVPTCQHKDGCEDPAEVRCKECSKYFCKCCSQAFHRHATRKHHSVVDIEQDEKEIDCSICQEMEAARFCNKCQYICEECFKELHTYPRLDPHQDVSMEEYMTQYVADKLNGPSSLPINHDLIQECKMIFSKENLNNNSYLKSKLDDGYLSCAILSMMPGISNLKILDLNRCFQNAACFRIKHNGTWVRLADKYLLDVPPMAKESKQKVESSFYENTTPVITKSEAYARFREAYRSEDSGTRDTAAIEIFKLFEELIGLSSQRAWSTMYSVYYQNTFKWINEQIEIECHVFCKQADLKAYPRPATKSDSPFEIFNENIIHQDAPYQILLALIEGSTELYNCILQQAEYEEIFEFIRKFFDEQFHLIDDTVKANNVDINISRTIVAEKQGINEVENEMKRHQIKFNRLGQLNLEKLAKGQF